MNIYIIFGLGALGTYLLRVSMLFAGSRVASSDWLESRISLVSPAVLAAIVASALLISDGQVVAPNIVVLVSMLAAITAVARSGNVGSALAVGLPIYWIGSLLGLA